MEKGSFYIFKLKGWKEPICGIIENIGSEWILIKHIVSDYTFDGYSLIQTKYIKDQLHDDETVFTEKVLLAKGIMDISVPYDIPLDTPTAPFEWFKKQGVTTQFNPKDETICYVGKVTEFKRKYFQFISLSPKGCWDPDFYKCTFAKIRTINIDSDYVNSLLIYNEKYKK